MSSITIEEMFPLLKREMNSRRGVLLAIFVSVSLAFLITGFFWKKQYMSFVQIYVDDSRVVAPLLDAQIAQNADEANVAQEELFSAEILDRILDEVGYVKPGDTKVSRERARKDLIENTEVSNINNQLIEIAVYHHDPAVAFRTAELYAELFLEKSKRSSAVETSGAFDFIIDQVETYRDKLEDAESRLESFRTRYPGVSTSVEGNVDQRIVELRRELETAQLEFAVADERRASLERALVSESSTLSRDYEQQRFNGQILQLQSEVDRLSLDYTPDYPDIVRLNQQIEDTKQLAEQSRQRARQGNSNQTISLGGAVYSGSANLNPAYQKLRSDLAETRATADSLRSKISQTQALLNKELERSTVSTRVERELAELTRDYQINKELYEDLVRRRESARLSMTLGAEQQGVLYRIQEPANYPVLPTGLRFMHLAAAGLMLGTLLPLVYLVTFLKLDPRVRTASAVTDILELPLLSTVPHMVRAREKPRFFHKTPVIVGTVGCVLVLYATVALLKVAMANYTQGGGLL